MTRKRMQRDPSPSHGLPSRVQPGRLARGAVVAVITVLAVVLARDIFHTPIAVPASAPDTEFSALRALGHVEAIAGAPRPQGSEAAAAARAYIVDQLESLGLTPEVQTLTVVRTTAGTDAVFAARVVNVLARIQGADSTGAIVASAHYDSGPNALGAADCGACVASVLETARALMAGPQLKNDVILLFPDGEETQLFGSYAFVERHPWARDVAFAVNLEAQGINGPAVFYVSSPDDENVAAKVIEYADQPVAWSFLSALIRNLVGGSDLDSFTHAGIPGAGFAFFESEQYYHTRLDAPGRLDAGSLQHLGAYALGVTRGLGNDDLDKLEGESDSLYFAVWRGAIARYPAIVAPVLALLATSAFAGALFIGRQRGLVSLWRAWLSAGLSVGVLLLAILVTTLIWTLVRIANPDYHVLLVGVVFDADTYVLAFVVLAGALFLAARLWSGSRLSRLELAAGSVGAWCFLTLLTSFVLPPFSPIFTWPCLAALAAFGFAVLRPALGASPWSRLVGFAIVLFPTVLLLLPTALIFQTLGGRMEALTGIPLMGLPILWAALGFGLLLPFLPLPAIPHRWTVPVALELAAILLVGWTSATATFDADHPKPNLVIYSLDADSATAHWFTTGDAGFGRGRSGQLDGWTSQFFGDDAEEAEVAPWSAAPTMTNPGYRAAAPVADLAAPAVEVLSDEAVGDDRRLRLRVTSPRGAANIRMHVDAAVSAATIEGIGADVAHLDVSNGLWIHYLDVPEEGIEVEFTLEPTGPVEIDVQDWSQGLPDVAGLSYEPRPASMMASAHDLADTTMVRTTTVIE